jgi:pimeloyl-ACP methyl ester carboxylesterase
VTPASHVIYLHGFASSAQSSKASFFRERLDPYGVAFTCPDLNEPDFRSLTMTRMLDQLSKTFPSASGPAALIGSSLGGTLAILAAARFPHEIDRVVLLAPAVMFAKPGDHVLPPERVEQWRRQGALPFQHHAYNEERLLDVAFYEDSLGYDAFGAAFWQPALVFQGMRDASVDYHTVEHFSRHRPNVTLSLLNDDHQLHASLPRIWNDTSPFLGLVE